MMVMVGLGSKLLKEKDHNMYYQTDSYKRVDLRIKIPPNQWFSDLKSMD